MKSTVLMRSLLLSAVFVGECVPTVWADAIVLRNRSSASGAVSIAEGGQVILRSEFLSPPASVTGDFTFGDTLADFSGLLVAPGTHVIHHSGVIAPGHYVLSGALASIFEVTLAASPNPRGALAFDVGFTLEPVPIPTPEPATLALVGTGLVCAIGRASKQ